MKRNIHINWLFTLVLLVLLLIPTSVKALQTNTSPNIQWKILNSNDKISPNKIWKIRFNKPLDMNSITKDNIYITDDNNDNFPIVYMKNQNDNKLINIAPKNNYTYGKRYTLWIKNLKGKEGQSLGKNTKMSFTIKQDPSKINKVTVSNATELLENIDSNKTIILKSGNYDLLNTPVLNNKHIKIEEVFDGYQLVIKDVNNLSIKGESVGKINLLVHPRYANVLSFRNCNNLNISNIIAGHYPDEGYCTGGVFDIDNSSDITIKNSELFGCGTEGLTLNNVKNLTFISSVIRDCSYGIMSLTNCKNINFNNSKFHDNREFDLIKAIKSTDIKFDNCNIYNNSTNMDYSDMNYNLFSLNYSNIILNNCSIYDNKVYSLANDIHNITLNTVTFKNNTFD